MPASPTDSFDLLLFLWKQRKPVILLTLLGAVVSIVVSLLVTPKFAAEVILYPTSRASVSRSLISTTGGNQNDLLSIGEEEETEQMLQILQSDQIRDKLVKKFDLLNHYRIPEDSKIKYTLLNNRIKKNITYRKTEYMAVRIRVMDEDPVTAAAMANEVAVLLDSTVNRMQKKKALEALKIVEREYLTMQQEISALEDSLRKLGNLGIYDVESQSQGLQEAYLEAVRRGDKQLAAALNKKMVTLGEYGSNYLFLKELLANESVRFSSLKEKYAEARVDAAQNLPQTYIVKRAEVPEKKAWPRRSLIVMTATVAAFLFAIVLLLLLDAVRQRMN